MLREIYGFFTTVSDFLAPLFSFSGVSSFTGMVVCAIVIWLGGPKAKLIALVAAAILAAFYIGNFIGDHNGTERIQIRWDAANKKAAADADKRDKEIAAAALKNATDALANIEALSKDQVKEIAAYAASIASPSRAQCALTRSQLDSLRKTRDAWLKRRHSR